MHQIVRAKMIAGYFYTGTLKSLNSNVSHSKAFQKLRQIVLYILNSYMRWLRNITMAMFAVWFFDVERWPGKERRKLKTKDITGNKSIAKLFLK